MRERLPSSLEEVEAYLTSARAGLCASTPLGGLHQRNPTAHKWKTLFRCFTLRELVSWRLFDLLDQVVFLEKNYFFLGSRILLRSAIETVAILIFCNRKMESIVRTGQGFHEFGDTTVKLLIGATGDDKFPRMNILNILEKSKKDYPKLLKAYDDLSESTHPNWSSLTRTYSKFDRHKDEIFYGNFTMKTFGNSQLDLLVLIIVVFIQEYNETWIENIRAFEGWIEKNDQKLEATMNK